MVQSPLLKALRLTVVTTMFTCAGWASGCSGSSTSQQIAGPTSVKCQTSIAGMPSSFSASGGQIGARVLTPPECAWSATTDAPWMQVEPPAGQGEADITVRVAENQLATRRTASVHVNGVQVTLSQEPAALAPDPSAPEPKPDPPSPPSPAPSPPPPTPAPPPSPPQPSPPPPPAPPAPSVADFSGAVSGLTGSCPDLSFSVGGRSVVTDSNTKFTQGNCKHMVNGLDVGIVGTVTASGTVHATRVEMKNNLEGI